MASSPWGFRPVSCSRPLQRGRFPGLGCGSGALGRRFGGRAARFDRICRRSDAPAPRVSLVCGRGTVTEPGADPLRAGGEVFERRRRGFVPGMVVRHAGSLAQSVRRNPCPTAVPRSVCMVDPPPCGPSSPPALRRWGARSGPERSAARLRETRGSERQRSSRITAGAGGRRLPAPSGLRFAGRCDPAPPGSPQGDRSFRHAIPIRDSNPESEIGVPGIPS